MKTTRVERANATTMEGSIRPSVFIFFIADLRVITDV